MPELTLTEVPPVRVGMLVRRPPQTVFDALADPAVTTSFWFTASTGRLAAGARVRWDWGGQLPGRSTPYAAGLSPNPSPSGTPRRG